MPRGNETPHRLLSRTLAQEIQIPVTSVWGLGGNQAGGKGQKWAGVGDRGRMPNSHNLVILFYFIL